MKKRDYPAIYRVMHWSLAISMLLLLITIFLRLTWMEKVHVAGIIEGYLSENEQSLTQDQLIVLAKKIRKPMWDWHIYLGYFITGVYVIRLSLPFFGHMKFSNPTRKGLSRKVKFHFWTYIIFYACLGVSLFTGLVIDFGPAEYKKSMETIHKLSIYYFVAFIVIHLCGVIWAELTNQKGIVSGIISGGQKKEEG